MRAALLAADFFLPERARLRVLNLACGRADETGALAKALAPMKIDAYLGIDLRPDTIAEAKRRWILTEGEIEFRCGDAQSILPGEADLVFIRHQNYWHDPVAWDRLLDKARAALKPAGVLVCTSYFDREHELLLAAMATRGVRPLVNVRHPESRPLPDAPGKSVDRWLAIFPED